MNKTPLLRKLRDNGATLYVFPSASEDIGLNLNSRATGVAMSHYALLNLPCLCGKSTAETESIAIAEDLLNYVMNFETLLLNQDDYNYQEYHTVSERVFWHWLYSYKKKLAFGSSSDFNGKISDTYSTEAFSKDKVVQCFGSIDAGNSLSTEFGMFNETYINIPTSYGNGPVFFKTVLDSYETNYILGNTYKPSTTNTLQGRTLNDEMHLTNMLPKYDDETKKTYSASDSYEIVKDITQIQTALRSYTGNSDIQITSFDDVNIDNKELFKDTVFDITTNTVEFGFNAILLYYSVYDLDDTTKSAYATNLFGIIFLDSPLGASSDGNTIICLNKRKSFSGSTSSFFGNSYSFRVNIKTMSVYDNTDAVIQDNTTMSSTDSVEFSDVISNLNKALDIMNTNVQSTMAIQDQYMLILRYYDDFSARLDDVSTKVNSFLTASKLTTLTAEKIKANLILPEDTESNQIKLKFAARQTDYIDNEYYQGSEYAAPILITNDYNTFNVPLVYKPILDENSLADTALGDWTDSIDNVEDIISLISVKYYKYIDLVYPSMILPEAKISACHLTNILYRNGSSIDSTDESLTNVKFINYEALIPLMIAYIQLLKAEIDDLKS